MQTFRAHPRCERFIFFIALFLISHSAVAKVAQSFVMDPVAIVADEKDTTPALTILTEKDLQAKNAKTVADALRDTPGVEVVSQGGPGQTTSIFIRGARSEDTLVLIDGMEVNDVLSPAGAFDFSSLTLENIERIEVYRGPQSVRFGAGALGGVINIITRAGRPGQHMGYLLEGGSFDTWRAAASTDGQLGAGAYSFGYQRLQTQGFSAASAGPQAEKDAAAMDSFSSKLSWKMSKTSQLEATLKYLSSRADLDLQGGPTGDDPNDETQGQQLVTGLRWSDRFWNDNLRTSWGFFFSDYNRDSSNKPDLVHTDDSTDSFRGQNQKLQADTEWLLNAKNSFKLQLQLREESGSFHSVFNSAVTDLGQKSQNVAGEALSYQYESESWFADAGVRLNQSSQSGEIQNTRAALGRHFVSTGSQLSWSYGTGFKLPSLYQLYSSYGDTSLNSEKSETWEARWMQKWGRQSSWDVAYFESHFRDMIDFNFVTNKYFNVSRARSRGVEFDWNFSWSALRTQWTYLYLESVDELTGWELLRRPHHAASVSLQYSTGEAELWTRYRYRSERVDVDPVSFERATNNHYNLVDIGASYKFSPRWKLAGRVENVFDEVYEEVMGYQTSSRAFYLSLSGEWD